MTETHVAAFVAELRGSFYVDEDAIRDAIARRTSFNVVHLGSYFNADVFIAKADEPSRLEMERRQRFTLGNPSTVRYRPGWAQRWRRSTRLGLIHGLPASNTYSSRCRL